MGYATPAVKMLKVAEETGEPAVAPTVRTRSDKSYPIARSLYIYTLGEPQGAVKSYIDWILSRRRPEDRRGQPATCRVPDQRAKH